MAVRKFPPQAALVACNGGWADGCGDGCMGCGACAAACRFDAVHLNQNGVAEVSGEKCTACGACIRVCPKELIHIHDCGNPIVVKCSNRKKGAAARKQCQVSCTGCGVCERTCTAGAVRVMENCAVIDESICLSCGMCAVKCPRHAIYDLRGILAGKS